MFRKKKRSKHNKIATYLLGDAMCSQFGKKGKKKGKKYVGFSHEEIAEICTSMETVEGVKVLRTW